LVGNGLDDTTPLLAIRFLVAAENSLVDVVAKEELFASRTLLRLLLIEVVMLGCLDDNPSTNGFVMIVVHDDNNIKVQITKDGIVFF
jgi:hypothetical protein